MMTIAVYEIWVINTGLYFDFSDYQFKNQSKVKCRFTFDRGLAEDMAGNGARVVRLNLKVDSAEYVDED